MAKKIKRIAKLEIVGGKAKPGPELASLGINMMPFCIKFNEETKKRMDDIVPVVITAYEDKSFDFVLKTTPTAVMLCKAAGIEKGAGVQAEKVATLTIEQLREIAKYKMVDLNANDIDAAIRIIEGTARNMGIAIAKPAPSKGDEK